MFGTGNGLAALGGFMTLFLILLGILWLLVPFAIFGIKPLLRQLITEQKRTNEVLTRISQQIHPIALAIVVLIAAVPPLRRALAVSPTIALRAE